MHRMYSVSFLDAKLSRVLFIYKYMYIHVHYNVMQQAMVRFHRLYHNYVITITGRQF